MVNWKKEPKTVSRFQVFLQILMIFALVELIIMGSFRLLGINGPKEFILDPVFLAILSGPFLYRWVIGNAVSTTEEKLIESEHQYKTTHEMLSAMYEASPLAIIVVDKEERVQLWNPAAEKIFGWRADEVIGQPYPIIPQSDKKWIESVMCNEIKVADKEVKRLKKDGTLIDVSLSNATLHDHEGNVNGVLAIIMDSSQRKQAESDLRQTLKQLEDMKFALDESAIVSITDSTGLITYVNDKFCRISKYTRDELIGQNHRIIKSGHHPTSFFAEMWKLLNQGKVFQAEVKNQAKDGSQYWVETTIVPFLDDKGQPYQHVAIRRDITDRKRAQEVIQHMAYHDDLTELPNRRKFKKSLAASIESARCHDHKLAVLFFDIDRFKNINDALGHDTGDRLLQVIAKRLEKAVGDQGMVARMGGDEFMVMLPCLTSPDEATLIAQTILEVFHEPVIIYGQELHITSSIGISIYPDHGDHVEILMKYADAAMYHAKREGRNNIQVYSKSMFKRAHQMLITETHLHRALEREELMIYYQPQMDLRTGKLVGMESLIRWDHPEWGFVSPGTFIPVAEETGLIIPIGEWVLRTACLQNKAWQTRGYEPVVVSVNLSIRQFLQSDLIDQIARILQETGLEPRYLELEITESMTMDVERTIQTLINLKALGVGISMDDFGTGYSSLNNIKRFPIDKLKIDQSFIRDLPNCPKDAAIVSTIIGMAKNLQLKAIAEGVETIEQMNFLKEENCDEIQGYYWSPPIPAMEIERFFQPSALHKD